jgi:hypothetical protein
MSMGKGMRMYLMAGGDQQRRSEQGSRDGANRTYDLSNGRFDVHVGDGSGNRGGEMRRIGDPRSEYGGMETHEGQQTEARYRGKDGRYHAGTRRSEYGGVFGSPCGFHLFAACGAGLVYLFDGYG